MAGSGIASTRAGKTKVVEEVSEMLSTASLVFALPSSGIKANQVVQLRKELPEGCTARVVKNKLMRIACKGSQFEGLSEITTGENFWMFVDGEENLAEPIKLITKFAKANMDKENVRPLLVCDAHSDSRPVGGRRSVRDVESCHKRTLEGTPRKKLLGVEFLSASRV